MATLFIILSKNYR